MKRKEAVAQIPLRELLKTMRAAEIREALLTLQTSSIVYEHWVDDWHLMIIYNPDEELDFSGLTNTHGMN